MRTAEQFEGVVLLHPNLSLFGIIVLLAGSTGTAPAPNAIVRTEAARNIIHLTDPGPINCSTDCSAEAD